LTAIKIVEVANPHFGTTAFDVFLRTMMAFYFQLFVPILAIFFGSSVINEELDNKTLVYLTTTPVPKIAIFLGKFMAHWLLCAVIIGGSLGLSFIIANFSALGTAAAWLDLAGYVGISWLALWSYCALFALLGTFMRKSILLGLFFAFGWEAVVQYFPGSTQKFTLIHYIKSLLPIQPADGGFLVFRLEPSSVAESLLMLLFIGALALVAAALIFKRKEYIISDSV